MEAEHDNFQAALATLRAQSSLPEEERRKNLNQKESEPTQTEPTEAEPQAIHQQEVKPQAIPQQPIFHKEVEAALLGLRLCLALDRFWMLRGYARFASEHLAWFLPRVQNAPPDDARASLLARGYVAQGRAFALQGDLPAALAPLQTALRLWRRIQNENDNQKGLVDALMSLGEVCYWLGHKDEALELLTESEEIARRAGNSSQCASILLTLGSIALDEQDSVRAERLHLESLEFARQHDNHRLMARALCNLGEIAREQNRLATARTRCEQALEAAQEVGDQATSCYIRLSLGRIACAEGDADRAEQTVQECLRYVSKAGTRRLLGLCLLLSAQIAGLQGHWERCAILLGAGHTLRNEEAIHLFSGEANEEEALITAARQTLEAGKYEAFFARGLALSAGSRRRVRCHRREYLTPTPLLGARSSLGEGLFVLVSLLAPRFLLREGLFV